MRDTLPIDAKGQGPTGPRTPEGKRACRAPSQARLDRPTGPGVCFFNSRSHPGMEPQNKIFNPNWICRPELVVLLTAANTGLVVVNCGRSIVG